MGNSWYYVRGECANPLVDRAKLRLLEAEGQPLDLAQLRQMVVSGRIADGDSVWCEGMAEWACVTGIPDLTGAVEEARTRPMDQRSKPVSPAGIYSNAFMPKGLPYASVPPAYAGLRLRFAAMVLDALIYFVLILPVILVLYYLGDVKTDDEPMGQFVSVVIMIGAWLYFAIQECRPAQATIGKRAMGLIVCDLEGRQVTFGRASGRHIGKYVSQMTLCFGYLMAGFTAKKQTLHDMIAGCVVLKKPQDSYPP